MTEVVHADIFFFITSIAVIVVGAGALIALYYAIVILRDVRAVVEKIRQASEEIEEDFESLRANIKNEGAKIKTIAELILAFIRRKFPKVRGKKKDVVEID